MPADAVNEEEVAAIATHGVGQSEISNGLLGRNLWLAQTDSDSAASARCCASMSNATARRATR